MGTSFDYLNLRFTLTNSGQFTATRDGQPWQPNPQAEKAARVALTRWNIAYGYACGAQNAQPHTRATITNPDHPDPHTNDDQARAFATAYASHTYRTLGQPQLTIADAHATWIW